MFKKIILSFMICISMLCNPLIASADTGIQFFDNIDSLEVAHVWVDGLHVRALQQYRNMRLQLSWREHLTFNQRAASSSLARRILHSKGRRHKKC